MIGPVRAAARLVPGRRSRVAGTVALVTGGADGIGAALVAELQRRGATVAVVDLHPAPSAELAITADVRDRRAMAEAALQVVRRFGRLDLVVANAGITPPPATLRTIDPEQFERVLDVNLRGVFNTVHPCLDAVVEARGHVVVIASCAAFAPGAGGASYMVSKAAVEQLGRALRLELAPHGAGATVAYLGVVDTALARATLDDDPLGRALDRRLPAPLRSRISARDAARVVVDGVERRAPRVVAPVAWQGWALTRGLTNPVLDALLARDRSMHRLLLQLEARAGG